MAGETSAAGTPGGITGETAARCPRCKGPFGVRTTPQGVRLDQCSQCKGIWLDKGEINFFTEEWEYLRDYALNRSQPTAMPCPSCGGALAEGTWTSAEIKVDKCPACGGLFFETGELAAVGRLHRGVEQALAEERAIDWFAFPRLYLLAGAALVAAASGLVLLAGLFSGGLSATAAAALGIALFVIGACRFTGNQVGDVSARAVRGLDFPMSVVPQRVSLSGTLVTAPDEIRLVDATGSLPIWKRHPLPPIQKLDDLWVEPLRRLPPDIPVRVTGWYKAFPFHRLQVVSVLPQGGGPGAEIRSLTESVLEWAFYGGGAVLLLLAIVIPAAAAKPRVEWSLARELAAPEAESWVRLGVHAAHQEKFALAKDRFDKAIASDVEGIGDDRAVSEAHFNLAVIALLEGKQEAARASLAAALAKDSRNERALEVQDLLERGRDFDLPSSPLGPGK